MNDPNDRDQALERLLRESFNPPSSGASDLCLDPEVLAAWADGGLSGRAREIAEAHVADCGRCQTMIAVLVQASPDVVEAGDHKAEPASRNWLAWLVPLTAAAAAIAIWVAVPHGPGSTSPQVAESPRQVDQPKVSGATVPGTQPEPQAPANAESAARSDRPGRDQAQATEMRKDTARRELDRPKQESASADSVTTTDLKAPAAAPAAASTAAAPAAAAVPPSPTAREALQDRDFNSAAPRIAGAITAVVQTARWRISGTALEHSPDGGSTWESVVTGVTSGLTAVSSPSPAVCWVVGRDGVVLRTTDGRNFSRVTFPEITDLSAVEAADGQLATVTTRDGRMFRTSDGGATWEGVRR